MPRPVPARRTSKPLGEYLIDDGALADEDLQRALAQQHELHAKGERKRIGEVLLDMRLVTRDQLQRAVDRQRLERS